MKKSHKKGSQQEAFRDSLRRIAGITVGILVILHITLMSVVMPYYYTNGYQKIGTNKSEFFHQLLVKLGPWILLSVLIYCILSGRELRKLLQLSVTDCFVCLYMCGVGLSFLCSEYSQQAFLGAAGWNMGFLVHTVFVLGYFIISRMNWSRQLFYLLWLPSMGVFVIGILNSFGFYFLKDMTDAVPTFISTIGNINWYCGYQVIVGFIPIIMLVFYETLSSVERMLCVIGGTISLISLIVQGSNSGYLAFAAILGAMFFLAVGDAQRMRRLLPLYMGILAEGILFRVFLALTGLQIRTSLDNPFVVLPGSVFYGAALAGLLLLAGLYWLIVKGRYSVRAMLVVRRLFMVCLIGGVLFLVVGIVLRTCFPKQLGFLPESIFLFRDEWGSNRGSTFKAGVWTFLEQNWLHKLVGVGPDMMYVEIYGGKHPELYNYIKDQFDGLRLVNAHNEWLTLMINEGILGAVAFIGAMISMLVRCMREWSRSFGAFVCGICLLGYTVNNVFSFQQIMSFSFMLVLFGVGESYLRSVLKESQ